MLPERDTNTMALQQQGRSEDPRLAASIAKALTDLDANVAAADVLRDLKALEPSCAGQPRLRAGLCQALGIALNRLGLAGEALGALVEAEDLFAQIGDAAGSAATWRSIAQIHVWQGDGRQAAFALLRAIAEGGGDALALALSLLEAARLNLEMGQPRDAAALLGRAMAIGQATLAKSVRQRAEVSLLQALVASGQTDAATHVLQGLDLHDATPRLKHLALIERASLRLAAGDLAGADAALQADEALLPPSPQSFERVEHAQAKARNALARRDGQAALDLLDGVVARYAEDDLAGREVTARLLASDAMDLLERPEAADDMLAAALRRAVTRGLNGYADAVRERFVSRGRGQPGWQPGGDAGPTIGVEERRFVRVRPLGRGGFGSVSRAYDLRLGIEIALKTVRLAATYDEGTRDSLLEGTRKEVAAASRLRHPGVGRVYGAVIHDNGDLILVRDFVEGAILRDAAATLRSQTDKLTILLRLAQVLVAIHAAGIVHRDLKPENVVLREGNMPVVIDFGIAQIGGQSKDATTGTYTLAYAAPEQIAGHRVDARADLFAFARMAFELMVGQLPPEVHQGVRAIASGRGRHRSIRDALRLHDVGDQVSRIVDASLSGPRWLRPRSAQAWVDVLQAELDRRAPQDGAPSQT